MDRILLAVSSYLLLLFVLPIIDITACAYSSVLGKTSYRLLNKYRKILLISVLTYLGSNILVYLTGIMLILRGGLIMNSSQLIINIASKMHLASVSFVVAALIATVLTFYSATTRRGNTDELKALISRCIWYAVLFWVLAWLIV